MKRPATGQRLCTGKHLMQITTSLSPSLLPAKKVENKGRATMHYPEVIVNNFHTRLGHQVSNIVSRFFPVFLRSKRRKGSSRPTIILHSPTSPLSQVARMFMSLFPQQPEFEGRSAVTFHNQRDYIFFRRHRYIFHNQKRVGLQELGPRFTVSRR